MYVKQHTMQNLPCLSLCCSYHSAKPCPPNSQKGASFPAKSSCIGLSLHGKSLAKTLSPLDCLLKDGTPTLFGPGQSVVSAAAATMAELDFFSQIMCPMY